MENKRDLLELKEIPCSVVDAELVLLFLRSRI